MMPTTEIPDDPALPALEAIRVRGLAGALPALELGDGPVELLLRGYTRGSRATLEARSSSRRVAIKAYADDPAPEAALYETLTRAGLADGPGEGGGGGGAQVPRLLSWDPALKVVAMSWLDGPTAEDLVKSGRGPRAGELGAAWFRRASAASFGLGPPAGAARVLAKADKWVAVLDAADPGLGAAAAAVAAALEVGQPSDTARRAHLVHGTLYARHVVDLGPARGAGVIDWQRFGQGPLELDAGVFLATVSRLGLRDPAWAGPAAGAEAAFLSGTGSLLDPRTLAWYRAAALLHLARRSLKRRPPSEAHAVLREAVRLAESE